jgi:cytochrome c
MKKIFFIITIASLFTACGSGGGGDEKPKVVDITENPDYKKGLAAIEKTPICFTCHKIDEKVQGPAWREVANKYGGQDTAVNYLVGKIINGGTGVWGEIYMPPNSAVPKEDVEAIVKYILLLKNK